MVLNGQGFSHRLPGISVLDLDSVAMSVDQDVPGSLIAGDRAPVTVIEVC
jgi:hypothetical protein